ncbi:MAG TPA: DUF2182 domain-containing protein, partial [Rubrobacteraceae bacterium]|nr:DUF2182 domain-containing protein [Rubrobacteraceae bacterium]
GTSAATDHHALIEGDHGPWLLSLAIFTSFWLVMVAAMMLPANMNILAALGSVAPGARSRALATGTFLAGYALVWASFGAGAFAADTAVHALAYQWHWLHEHEWIILATTLATVGLYQLIPTKRRYLERCRHQTDYISRHPDDTPSATLLQGLHYGKCELACCWAPMLLMVAVGHHLVWMLLLAGVMLAEKCFTRGVLLARLVGAALVLCSPLVFLVDYCCH